MNNTTITTNYIYLLQEREFIKSKENIYKVGMTKKKITNDLINIQRFGSFIPNDLQQL